MARRRVSSSSNATRTLVSPQLHLIVFKQLDRRHRALVHRWARHLLSIQKAIAHARRTKLLVVPFPLPWAASLEALYQLF